MLEILQNSDFVVGAVIIAFAIASYAFRLLSAGGIAFASGLGVAAYLLGGLVPFFTLLVFYVLAELATWAGRKGTDARHEKRTSSNIFGNCVAALAALFIGQGLGFFGAISAAFADTISSEIGLLSSRKPVLITTLREVEKGTDGGVTALGFGASLVAAAVIGAVYYFFVGRSLVGFSIIVMAGFFGTAFDSVLGATLQKKGLLTNTQVNFVASIFGAAVAMLLGSVL